MPTKAECIIRRDKLIVSRDKAQASLDAILDAGAASYGILGRNKTNLDPETLQKSIDYYNQRIDELNAKIDGNGGLKVSYGILNG